MSCVIWSDNFGCRELLSFRTPSSNLHKNETKLGNNSESKNRKWNFEVELGGKERIYSSGGFV